MNEMVLWMLGIAMTIVVLAILIPLVLMGLYAWIDARAARKDIISKLWRRNG